MRRERPATHCHNEPAVAAQVDDVNMNRKLRMNAYRKSCNKPARAPSKWWLAALLLGCLPASLNAEGQSPLKARLMEEAPKAWEGYRGYFMNSVKGSSVAVSKELLGSEPP